MPSTPLHRPTARRQVVALVAVAALATACGVGVDRQVREARSGHAAAVQPDGAAPAAPPVDDVATTSAVALDVTVDALSLVDGDEARLLVELDPAGESRFVDARLRPDSTGTAGALVAVTEAEGMLDLRWLTWDGAEVSGLVAVEGAFPADLAVDGVATLEVDWTSAGATVGWRLGDASGSVEAPVRAAGA